MIIFKNSSITTRLYVGLIIMAVTASEAETYGVAVKTSTALSESFINQRGQRIVTSYWPSKLLTTRALVVICHGFSEHILYYEDLAQRLSAIGAFVFGHDHIGHGKSDGLGGHVNDFDHYVDDILQHVDAVTPKFPGIPIFIIGHSLGGMISIRSAMRRPKFFAGVVLMGPCIQPDPREATPFRTMMARVLGVLLPYITIGRLDLNQVTRDKKMVRRLQEDDLRYHGGVRALFALNLLHSMEYVDKRMEEIEWPYLILHGENDRLCSPQGSRDFFKRTSSIDKTLKFFPEAFHHLYIEIPEVREEALEDTVAWIQKKLPPLSRDGQ